LGVSPLPIFALVAAVLCVIWSRKRAPARRDALEEKLEMAALRR